MTSPYSNLASLQSDNDRLLLHTVRGSYYETIYGIAHRTTGDWRNWRAILERSEVEDPFLIGTGVGDLTVLSDAEALDLLHLFNLDDVDVTEELGEDNAGMPVVSTTLEVGTPLRFRTVEVGTTVEFEVNTGEGYGPVTVVDTADLNLAEPVVTVTIEDTEGDTLEAVVDADLLLVLILAQEIDAMIGNSEGDEVMPEETTVAVLFVPRRTVLLGRG